MPTTTAAVIISDALKEIQVIGEDETPSATMYSDSLRMLNRLLDTLSNVASFAFDNTIRQLALTGQASFDIGPSGDIVALRPIKITSAFYTLGDIDYPVDVVSIEEYDAIPYKGTIGSVPDLIAYNGVYPNGVVYVYPKCSGGTINLRTIDLVKTFAATSTNIDLPEGYEDAIMLKLAIRMAPSYGKTVSAETKLAAKVANKIVKRTNTVIPKLSLPDSMTSGSISNLAAIYRG